MRINSSKSSRPIANRRPLRADRHVYRQLRRGTKRRFDAIFWLEILIIAAVILGLIVGIRRLFF